MFYCENSINLYVNFDIFYSFLIIIAYVFQHFKYTLFFLIIKATKKNPLQADCLQRVLRFLIMGFTGQPSHQPPGTDISTSAPPELLPSSRLKGSASVATGTFEMSFFDHKLGLCINFHNSTPHTSIKFINNRLYLYLRLFVLLKHACIACGTKVNVFIFSPAGFR